jgi:hypothetical protein
MNIYNQVIDVCKGKEGEILTSSQIKDMVSLKFNTNKSSILPSDYTYNRTNKGIKFNKHLFVMINRNEYKFIGRDYPYSGRIYARPKGDKNDVIVGEWKNGKYFFIENITDSKDIKEESTPILGKLSYEQIQKLYEEYMEILELEVNVFGLKPTEVRHLIGRIGEFKCALLTNGILSHQVNQHGFDVISNGKMISVKTTAQNSGFIAINKNTIDKVDDLMILQYNKHEFKIIYYGDIDKAISQARIFKNKFELDISKAKKLKSKST